MHLSPFILFARRQTGDMYFLFVSRWRQKAKQPVCIIVLPVKDRRCQEIMSSFKSLVFLKHEQEPPLSVLYLSSPWKFLQCDLNIAGFGEVSRVLRACHKASFCFFMHALSQPSRAMNYVSKSQTVNIFSLIIILPVWLHNYPKRRQIKLPRVTAHFALKLQDIPFMSFMFLKYNEQKISSTIRMYSRQTYIHNINLSIPLNVHSFRLSSLVGSFYNGNDSIAGRVGEG